MRFASVSIDQICPIASQLENGTHGPFGQFEILKKEEEMGIKRTCPMFGLVLILLCTGVPRGTTIVAAQGGTSPATAKPLTVAPCSATTVMDSAATTDPGTNISQLDAMVYADASGKPVVSPVHDWYAVTLDKPDNIRIEVTRTTPSARLDVFLFAPITRSDKPEGVVMIDSNIGATVATSTIGPRRVEAMRYTIGIRAQTGSSSYILTVTRGTDTTQNLFVDHRIASAQVPAGGLTYLNRFTPSRYPATVQAFTVFFQRPTAGAPDPTGQVLRWIVIVDPMGKGTPPIGVDPSFSVNAALPFVAGNYTATTGLRLGGPGTSSLGVQVPSGDFYVGFSAPTHTGIGLRFDTDGLPLNASFVSRDNGATFNPTPIPAVPAGTTAVVANALIRATVDLSACTP